MADMVCDFKPPNLKEILSYLAISFGKGVLNILHLRKRNQCYDCHECCESRKRKRHEQSTQYEYKFNFEHARKN